MGETVSVAKEADTKKEFSPMKSDNSIQRLRDGAEMQLGSLGSVIDSIKSDSAAHSVESIAMQLSGMHTVQRAPVLLALQQTHGNRYVQRVVSGIQAKLRIGQPGDVYEQEADRVADEVMRMSEPEVQRQVEPEEEEEILQTKQLVDQITPLVQRQVEEEEEEEMLQAKNREDATSEVSHGLESQINAIKGGGQPLAESERAFFEPRFGYDFSRVRVHADTRAAESALAVNARAFTRGHHIVFGAGQHVPEMSEGQRLLAHELTHTVQQGGVSERSHPPSLETSSTTGTTRNGENTSVSKEQPIKVSLYQPVIIARSADDVDEVITALCAVDPIAGVGDFVAAFRILGGLAMLDLLDTLSELKRQDYLDILINEPGAIPRSRRSYLMAAMHVVRYSGGNWTEAICGQICVWVSTLPPNEQVHLAEHVVREQGSLEAGRDAFPLSIVERVEARLERERSTRYEVVPREPDNDPTALQHASLESLFELYATRQGVNPLPPTRSRYSIRWVYSSRGSGLIRQEIRTKLEGSLSRPALRTGLLESVDRLECPAYRKRELRHIVEDVFESPSWRPGLQIPINPAWPVWKQRDAELWNSRGQLFTDLAHALDPRIEPYVAAGIMAAETGQQFFQGGRAIARFEARVFWNRWGNTTTARRRLFNQHFRRVIPHMWRRDTTAPFQTYHGTQDTEWEVLNFARRLDSEANVKAVESTSFGAGQTMGFNYEQVGFSSALEMLEHYQTRERAQIEGIFRYIDALSSARRARVINGIISGNFLPFSQAYGPQNPQAHARRITSAVNRMRRLVQEAAGAAP